jgi:hypothetical protein
LYAVVLGSFAVGWYGKIERIYTKLKLSPSNKPLSLSLRCGITGNAII